MQPLCHSCATDISDETQTIICQGFCKSVFHLGCAQIKADLWAEVKLNSGIFWMCPACRNLMNSVRFRDALGSTKEYLQATWGLQHQILDELKSEIRSNTEKINQILTRQPSTPQNGNPWPRISNRPAKRPRIHVDSSPTDTNTVKTLCGKKEAENNLIVSQSNPKFWLFLSRFSPHATVDEIAGLVQQNLETDQTVDVVKLVRKDTDLDQLKFVSFKVGIDPSMKEKAMQPAAWQKGIYFREFVNIERGVHLFRDSGRGDETQHRAQPDSFVTPTIGN
ncbi:uncharacterized protein LOC128745764 [Sabethes cyaneus]|uniref:uncharacterized protein LOC128745764 n=1 Tax=Sabethes cyaneus TaxID=53552 RepID=UPI00237E63C1|nr:uncharacterized protein LOC128745764 [Sabethes cyaneus]